MTKALYALIVLGIFLVIYIVATWQTNKFESDRDKRLCELIHGADNCVRRDGEWVRRGSSPLFGP